MTHFNSLCPDCNFDGYKTRRDFLATAGAGIVTAGLLPGFAHAKEDEKHRTPETLVKQLYESLTPRQKETICFDWDHVDAARGPLRIRVRNNWSITDPTLNSEFYTMDQRLLVRQIFEGIIHPDWHKKIEKQLEDDAGGFGASQSVAIFGKPHGGKFEFVMTGRHMTLRCDGNTTEHVAFGGPLFYGHDPSGSFYEGAKHEGNVFWEQALAANKVYQMLDGKQRKAAEVSKTPREGDAGFRSLSEIRGIPVSELSSDQKSEVQNVLKKLLEPYRQSDRDEVGECLKAQGGLEKCHLAFYTDADIGKDGVWDNWRLEGPAFVWHFRGSPHVHVWVNVADDPSVKINTKSGNRQRRQRRRPA